MRIGAAAARALSVAREQREAELEARVGGVAQRMDHAAPEPLPRTVSGAAQGSMHAQRCTARTASSSVTVYGLSRATLSANASLSFTACRGSHGPARPHRFRPK